MSKEQTTAPSHARRTRKKRIVGAAVALAIATGGGIAVVSTASAGDLGTVSFKTRPETDRQDTPRVTAWDLCRRKYPQTRSVEHLWSVRSAGSDEEATYKCREIPDLTLVPRNPRGSSS